MPKFNEAKPKSQFGAFWIDIQCILEKLFHADGVSRDQWHSLIRAVYTICFSLQGGRYHLTRALQQIFAQIVEKFRRDIWREEDDLFCQYVEKWKKFYFLSTHIPRGFKDLEIPGLGKASWKSIDKSAVHVWMLEAWNKGMFEDSTSRDQLLNATIKKIQEQRLGETTALQCDVNVMCQSFVVLRRMLKSDIYYVYKKLYVKSMKEFYEMQAGGFMLENGVLRYLQYAAEKLNDEEYRSKQCLRANDAQKAMAVLVEVLVTRNMAAFEEEFIPLVKQQDFNRLRIMYQLFGHVPTYVSKLPQQLQDFMVRKSKDDLKSVADTIDKDPTECTEKLLALYSQFTTLIHDAFLDDPSFFTARDRAFKEIVNDASIFNLELQSKSAATKPATKRVESKVPKVLASYCDAQLRNMTRSKNRLRLKEDQLEVKLKGVIQILKYVDGKDVFMIHYRALLKKRIFLQLSKDIETEENFIEWLRNAGMPPDYVRQLLRLFYDFCISSDFNTALRQHHSESGNFSHHTCQILAKSNWLGGRSGGVQLPQELRDYVSKVERFYHDRYQGRQLTWHHGLSIGTLKFSSNKGTYDLKLTTFQITVLLALEKGTNMTYELLRLTTEIEDHALRTTLEPLIAKRGTVSQILLCTPEVTEPSKIEAQTELRINKNFALLKNGKLLKKGNITLVRQPQMMPGTTTGNEEEGILRERELYTREAIAMLMKTRKTMKYDDLKHELVAILQHRRRFYPSYRLIKEQVEHLMEREICIRRDNEDINLFYYIV